MSTRIASADPQVRQIADLAWDMFSREEQYQIDRRMVHGTPFSPWLDADKNALKAAEDSGDIAALNALFQKYKKLDVAGQQGYETKNRYPKMDHGGIDELGNVMASALDPALSPAEQKAQKCPCGKSRCDCRRAKKYDPEFDDKNHSFLGGEQEKVMVAWVRANCKFASSPK